MINGRFSHWMMWFNLNMLTYLHNFSAFFEEELSASVKVTAKHQPAFPSFFFLPYCVNADS